MHLLKSILSGNLLCQAGRLRSIKYSKSSIPTVGEIFEIQTFVLFFPQSGFYPQWTSFSFSEMLSGSVYILNSGFKVTLFPSIPLRLRSGNDHRFLRVALTNMV